MFEMPRLKILRNGQCTYKGLGNMFNKSSGPLRRPVPTTGGSWWRSALEAVFGPVVEDRSALLRCLCIPLVLTLVAFSIAVALTAFSVPTVGTTKSTVAGLAYVYLMMALMWVPSYLVGLAVFWWNTRHSDDKLLFNLYIMPLVCALFIWFPSLVMGDATREQRMQMLVPLVGTGVILGYVWIGLVRLMYYVWRKK